MFDILSHLPISRVLNEEGKVKEAHPSQTSNGVSTESGQYL